jgi:hypothetical protein
MQVGLAAKFRPVPGRFPVGAGKRSKYMRRDGDEASSREPWRCPNCKLGQYPNSLQRDFHAFGGGADLGVAVERVLYHFVDHDVGMIGIVVVEN